MKLLRLVRIEDSEPAAGQEWHDVAAAESQVDIRCKGRILHQVRRVVVRISGTGAQIRGPNRVIRRNRGRDDFVNSNPRPCQRAVDTANKADTVGSVRPVRQSYLL